MLSTEAIILEYVCPGCGLLLTNIMFFSPFMDVLRATSETGQLGDLNPTPWAFMLGNCMGWLTYSFVINNYFAFWANAPALVLSVWLNLSAVKLQYENGKMGDLKREIMTMLEEMEEGRVAAELEQASANGSSMPSRNASTHSAPTDIRAMRRSIVSVLDDSRSQLSWRSNASNMSNNFGASASKRRPSAFTSSIVMANAGRKASFLEESSNNGFGAASNGVSSPGTQRRLKKKKKAVRQSFLRGSILGNSTVVFQRHDDFDRAGAAQEKKQQYMADYQRIVKQVTSNHNEPASSPHERLILIIVVFWFGIISLILFGTDRIQQESRELIVGSAANANTLFFYGAPLSTIFQVLRTRSTVSIHVCTMVTNTLTSFFWAAYGVAILDLFIFLPNAIGVALGAVQIVLCVIFPHRGHDDEEEEEDGVNENGQKKDMDSTQKMANGEQAPRQESELHRIAALVAEEHDAEQGDVTEHAFDEGEEDRFEEEKTEVSDNSLKPRDEQRDQFDVNDSSIQLGQRLGI